MDERLAFGRFEVERAARRLMADGVTVDLGGRAFDLLCALIDGRDRVVSKSELFDAAWPGRVVEENNLAVQISALRKILGAAAIVTVASHGYRFTLPVSQTTAGRLAPPASREALSERQNAAFFDGWQDGLPSTVAMAIIRELSSDDHDAAGGGSTNGRLASDDPVVARRHGGVVVGADETAAYVRFPTARAAVACAITLHDAVRASTTLPFGSGLRIGLAHDGRLRDEARDCAVSGLDNDCALALYMARSAGVGETHATASVRDAITDDVDCCIEDLGRQQQPAGGVGLRVFELRDRPSLAPAKHRASEPSGLKPLIAVLPFESRDAMRQQSLAVGELLADGLIEKLSHSRHAWRVISRLSASAFRGRPHLASDAQFGLGADFVVGGAFLLVRGRLQVTLQIVDSGSGEVVGVRRVDGPLSDLFDGESDLLRALLQAVQDVVYGIALKAVRTAPMPTLRSYALLLGGIQMMHGSSPQEFDASFRVMQQLVNWHPNAPEPRVWMAKWYALRAVQGLCTDFTADAKAAFACTGTALERDPNCAFALAMEGFVHVQMTHDYSAARERLEDALLQNDSETFAHLFNSVVQGRQGEIEQGLSSYHVALSTSPHDPARYMMDSIGAYLYMVCGQHAAAIELAKQSLRRNLNHVHTWRIMAISQQESGQLEAARRSVKRVLALTPDLTVERYLAGKPPGDSERQRFAHALSRAGLPAH